MSDDGRKDDVIVEVLKQQFNDFIKYDKERWDNYQKKYEQDWKHTQEWRKAHWDVLKNHTDLLNEIVPNYRRGMWVLLIVVSGSIGLLIKRVWEHVRFN